eukprot:685559-Rhodomonas_salina.2
MPGAPSRRCVCPELTQRLSEPGRGPRVHQRAHRNRDQGAQPCDLQLTTLRDHTQTTPLCQERGCVFV